MPTISAILSTYNRYESLMQAIQSVKEQTYQPLEIIVVNDHSEDDRYYKNRPADVSWIDLEKNTREIMGYPALGHVRNVGIEASHGEYLAFLDDDDMWLPDKTTIQLTEMISKGFNMSCTEGYMGDSLFDPSTTYPVYHREFYADFCEKFFTNYAGGWSGTLPDTFNARLIEQHNFIIHSSVMIKKDLLYKAGLYKNIPLHGTKIHEKLVTEDSDLWQRCLCYGDCLHVNRPLVYYDGRLSQQSLVQRTRRHLKHLLRICRISHTR